MIRHSRYNYRLSANVENCGLVTCRFSSVSYSVFFFVVSYQIFGSEQNDCAYKVIKTIRLKSVQNEYSPCQIMGFTT